MKFGFIGAGKVGFSLGKYFADNNLSVSGYFSDIYEDAVEAARFTESKVYDNVEQLLEDSDVLFLTVPDGVIETVWNQINKCHFSNKIVCHCSGALSSKVFSDIVKHQSFGYSIHPLFAVSDRYNSYKELSNAYFTIEGAEEKIDQVKSVFENLGNTVCVIDEDSKVKYHASAAMVSNLVVGLIYAGEQLLTQCGFDKEQAHNAFAPIVRGNVEHIISDGAVDALTGPIERCDVTTVKKHLDALRGNTRDTYLAVSRNVLEVAKEKNKDRDYSKMEELLR